MFEAQVTPLNAFGSFTQGFQAMDQAQARQQTLQQQSQQLAQKQAMLSLGQEAVRTGDPRALAMFTVADPSAGAALSKIFQEQTKASLGSSQAFNELNVADKPAAYQAYLQQAQKENPHFDMSGLPTEYDPKVVDPIINQRINAGTVLDRTYSLQETANGLQNYDAKTGKLTDTGVGVYRKPPTTQVNINNNEEGELYKKARGAQGEIYGDYIKQGNKSGAALASLDRAEKLIDQVGKTGKIAPLSAQIGNVLNQFGIKVDTSKIANVEELTQLSQTQVGQILGSGEYGAGTGISSVDLNAAGKRVYGADKTSQGNKQIIETLRALETRKREIGRITSRLINQGRASEIDDAIDALGSVFKEEENQVEKQDKKQDQTPQVIRTQKPINEMSIEELKNLTGGK